MALWTPMTLLNIWRIPLLFFVSGMGVYFALQNRSWKQLLWERTGRILLPFLFGVFCIVPLGIFILQYYYHWELGYSYHPGHLWFLGNIFIYVVILIPVFFYLQRNENGRLVTWIKQLLSNPLGLILVMVAFVAEVLWLKPNPYEMYAMTWHGFFLGLLAFFFGFCFVLSGDTFWKMVLKWRWLFIITAALFYTYRLFQPQMQVPGYLLAIESNCWIIAIFAWSYKYLNRPSKTLSYLSQAAYPIYILHMIFLFLGSVLIFPWDFDVRIQFVLLLLFTGIGCLATYEFLIRRVNIIRPLFGLKRSKQIHSNA